MSRIAKAPILLPPGVQVEIAGQSVRVMGPNGTLVFQVHPAVEVVLDAQQMQCTARPGVDEGDAQSGTARAILNNMVLGVHAFFEKRLQLVGVGYRAQVQNGQVTMNLGFSHPIHYLLPAGVQAEAVTPTEVLLKSFDKALLGQVAAQLRAFRPPEPYKGKGVRYLGELVRRKEAKKK